MRRKHSSKFCAMALAGLLTASVWAVEKPNVIFLLCDDLGYADVGYMQKRRATAAVKIQTPNIDQLAAEGTILTDHYCAAPVCAPSRASILTGQLQRNCSLRNNQFDKPIAETRTMGTVMRENGYETYALGKWGVGGGGESYGPRTAHPLARGFDHYYGFLDHVAGHTYYHYDAKINACYAGIYESVDGRVRGASGRPTEYEAPEFATQGAITYPEALGDLYWNATKTAEGRYSTDVFVARAKKYIEDQLADDAKKDKPFFLYFAVNTIHGSGQGHQNPSLPAGRKQNLHVPGFAYTNSTDAATGKVRWPLPVEPPGIRNTYHDPAYAGLNDSAQRYATAITRLDQALGDLVAFLKAKGIYENTIVIFTSDNGPAREYGADPRHFDSNGEFFGFKRDVYEGGLRVPAFVTWPKHAAELPRTNSTASISSDWLSALERLARRPTVENVPIPVSKELTSVYEFGSAERGGCFDGVPTRTRFIHGFQRWKREGTTVTLQAGGRDKPVVTFEDIDGLRAPDEATRRRLVHQDLPARIERLPDIRYRLNGNFADTGLTATFGVPSPLTAIGPEMGEFTGAALTVTRGARGRDYNDTRVAAEFTRRDSGSVRSSLGDTRNRAAFTVGLRAKVAPCPGGLATLFAFGETGRVCALAADTARNALVCLVDSQVRAEAEVADLTRAAHAYALVGTGREVRVLVDGVLAAVVTGFYPDTSQAAYGLGTPSVPTDRLVTAVGTEISDFEVYQNAAVQQVVGATK